MGELDNFFIERERIFRQGKEKTSRLNKRFAYSSLLEKIRTAKSVGLVGLRGVGKTTLILQITSELKNSFYFSTEGLILRAINLYDFASYINSKGYEYLFIDEIHFYPRWSMELKMIHDDFDINVVFTGSSRLAIEEKTEMLRRAVFFHLPPLSFREFLFLYRGITLPKLSLEHIIDIKTRKEALVRISPYAGEISDFLLYGGLPLGIESRDTTQYLGIVKKIIDEDIPAVRKVEVRFKSALYKTLKLLATSSPGEVSMHTISRTIKRHTDTVDDILMLLDGAGLITLIEPWARGPKLTRKEKKIAITIPFRSILCNSYGMQPNPGFLREDFFVHHIGKNIKYVPTSPKKTPDYVIDGMVFEIGGRSKTRTQVPKQGYLVVDDMSLSPDRIPLVLFGMLY